MHLAKLLSPPVWLLQLSQPCSVLAFSSERKAFPVLVHLLWKMQHLHFLLPREDAASPFVKELSLPWGLLKQLGNPLLSRLTSLICFFQFSPLLWLIISGFPFDKGHWCFLNLRFFGNQIPNLLQLLQICPCEVGCCNFISDPNFNLLMWNKITPLSQLCCHTILHHCKWCCSGLVGPSRDSSVIV